MSYLAEDDPYYNARVGVSRTTLFYIVGYGALGGRVMSVHINGVLSAYEIGQLNQDIWENGLPSLGLPPKSMAVHLPVEGTDAVSAFHRTRILSKTVTPDTLRVRGREFKYSGMELNSEGRAVPIFAPSGTIPLNPRSGFRHAWNLFRAMINVMFK